MKIIAINASFRGSKGYTQFLINKLFEGSKEKGAECETIVLSEYNIKRCTGCFSCQSKARLYTCIYDGQDDTKLIYDKMRAADIIVFATPVYVFNMSSLLKNLFDRYPSTSDCSSINISKKGLFFHDIDKKLCSKPFVTLICQDNLENETYKNIISFFKTYSKFMDAKYLGNFVRKSSFLAKQGKDTSVLDKYPELISIYQAFAEAGKELVTIGKIKSKTQMTANKELIHIPILIRFIAKFEFFHKAILNKIKTKKYM